jgi:hypothetical protein
MKGAQQIAAAAAAQTHATAAGHAHLYALPRYRPSRSNPLLNLVQRRVSSKTTSLSISSTQSCRNTGRNGPSSTKVLRLSRWLVTARDSQAFSPIDIELRSVERQLDLFGCVRGGRPVGFGQTQSPRLFSMSSNNIEGVLAQESSVDSKRDLENALRSACNTFIDHAARSIDCGRHDRPDPCTQSALFRVPRRRPETTSRRKRLHHRPPCQRRTK